jgi:predicted amidohydrolase
MPLPNQPMKKFHKMKVISIQPEMKDRSKPENLEYVLSLVDGCPQSDLILLPEIWPCGFFCFDRYRIESESIDGPIVAAFRQKAVERKCHILMGSIVEKDGDKLFNTSILLDPRGQIIARYRKIHLFGYQSEEKKLLTAGKEVIVAATPWGLVGISTCYDLRFPELFRKMLDMGATIFFVASAWPSIRLDAWRLFNRARALENLAYLISCNCAGSNAGNQYAGHSMIIDPLGNVVAEGNEGEDYIFAELDPGFVNSVRNDFRALDDRIFAIA